ncbi:MAG: class I SAM-dependent methyltransferase [candidate division Zixibacteria bacterium]|nr:class I SAM-dependent methyltransferase [candidate division Zixibacteria bacterium]MBU1470175.1 class I SAM-dependent methyltransferase [candidate division Zixibacteria bacterium]MBU2625936.1 class I SAM-dependent methyltransferase [candidate division Zixibacteria bacterium]
MEFYENLADRYDLMTRFDQRIVKDGNVLHAWIEKHGIKSAIDVACGTGLHSILLAKMGVQTVGTDISKPMLDRAKENAARQDVVVDFRQVSMEHLGESVDQRFDALFCLGNSLPHILNVSDLATVVRSFSESVVPGGIAVLQLINYHRVLENKKRLVGIHKVGETEFIRYYDFFPDHLRFNILMIDSRNGSQLRELESTNLYPYTKAELEPHILKSGFRSIECYGDMIFTPYDPESSTDLVICARR